MGENGRKVGGKMAGKWGENGGKGGRGEIARKLEKWRESEGKIKGK